MPLIITRPIIKTTNKGAWRGPLDCPFCNHDGSKRSRWKFIEYVSECMIRYQCKDCGRTIKYDFSNNEDFMRANHYGKFGATSLLDKIKAKFKKPQIVA